MSLQSLSSVFHIFYNWQIQYLCAAVVLTTPASTKPTSIRMANPLLSPFNTPYGVPPFDKIKDTHFIPALRAGMRAQKKEIRAIVENPAPPDFDNTILAMEQSGQLLRQAASVMYNLGYAHTSPALQDIMQQMAPILSAHSDSIFMHPSLFDRVSTLWKNRQTHGLRGEKRRLTRQYFRSFVRSGADLKPAQKKRVAGINQRLTLLSLQFGKHILDTINRYKLILSDEAQLSGLPDNIREAAAEAASGAGLEGKWLFTLQNASIMPFLQYADNRGLRHEIWNALVSKGHLGDAHDTENIIRETVALRAEKAAILGYKNYAEYILDDQMAQHPAAVSELLHRLWQPALHTAKEEAATLQKQIAQKGNDFSLQAWDWRYYAEKQRQEAYGLDENALKPYFSLEHVCAGAFDVASRLYKLQFSLRNDIPVYHPEAKAYLVSNQDGTDIGVLYLDFFPRETKQGGAWMTSFTDQHKVGKKRVLPVISIVCNFTPAIGNTPSLLTFDEVNTLFHEFGHALHGLLSNVHYRSLAGTNVSTDFVELPSQIMENWCTEKDVLQMYARHFQTGDPLPDEVIDTVRNAGKYGQGFATVEYLAACFLDMAYHTLPGGHVGDVHAFEQQKMDELGLIPEIMPRYRSTYFNHIFAGGYASGYYSYIWSEVLDADAFAAFREKGIFDSDTATAFRKHILEKGGSEEAMTLYMKFRGRKPDIQPLLEKRGLE